MEELVDSVESKISSYTFTVQHPPLMERALNFNDWDEYLSTYRVSGKVETIKNAKDLKFDQQKFNPSDGQVHTDKNFKLTGHLTQQSMWVRTNCPSLSGFDVKTLEAKLYVSSVEDLTKMSLIVSAAVGFEGISLKDEIEETKTKTEKYSKSVSKREITEVKGCELYTSWNLIKRITAHFEEWDSHSVDVVINENHGDWIKASLIKGEPAVDQNKPYIFTSQHPPLIQNHSDWNTWTNNQSNHTHQVEEKELKICFNKLEFKDLYDTSPGRLQTVEVVAHNSSLLHIMKKDYPDIVGKIKRTRRWELVGRMMGPIDYETTHESKVVYDKTITEDSQVKNTLSASVGAAYDGVSADIEASLAVSYEQKRCYESLSLSDKKMTIPAHSCYGQWQLVEEVEISVKKSDIPEEQGIFVESAAQLILHHLLAMHYTAHYDPFSNIFIKSKLGKEQIASAKIEVAKSALATDIWKSYEDKGEVAPPIYPYSSSIFDFVKNGYPIELEFTGNMGENTTWDWYNSIVGPGSPKFYFVQDVLNTVLHTRISDTEIGSRQKTILCTFVDQDIRL